MNLTTALKSWSVDNMKTAKDASDATFKGDIGKAIAEGKLTASKFAELSKPDEAAPNEFAAQMKTLNDNVSNLVKALTEKPKADPVAADAPTPDKAVEGTTTKDGAKDASGVLTTKKVGDMGKADANDTKDAGNVRVKRAAEQYSSTKTAALFPATTKTGRAHPLAGQPMKDFSSGSARTMDLASNLDLAAIGAYAKFTLAKSQRGGVRSLAYASLNDHDKDLLHHCMEKMAWGGATDGGDYADINNRLLHPHEQKALIDDSLSGGLEAAPIVFDDLIIQVPLLHSELYPLVNTISLERGRRVEGVSTGTVTASWGGVDDTAVALFNTASFVSAFDTTVYRWEGAFVIGLDFLSDTPIDFGAHVTTQYGERLLEDLDDVVATGNGTTQPEGVINKSGAVSVNFGGTTSLGNYESLMFGIGKAERKGNMAASTVFCGTDTSYARARAIPVGASDARRLGGMGGYAGVSQGGSNYLSYQWMDHPYKINNSLSNSQIFYAVLARYRMYRRRGMTMRTSTEGDTLIRKNEMLILATARYGGQMERGACAVVTTTAPA